MAYNTGESLSSNILNAIQQYANPFSPDVHVLVPRHTHILTLLKDSRIAKGGVFALVSFFALVGIFISIQRSKLVPSPIAVSFYGDMDVQYFDASHQPNARPSSSIIKGNKVATIIENRPLANLVPLILHFSAVLGPEWPIVVFTGATPPPAFKSAAIERLIKAGLLDIVPLSDDVRFMGSKTVSAFLASPWFWDQLAPADHVLLFQADSIICGNSERRVDDYLEYDFIGAPVSPYYGVGYNGGLSLRNRNMMLSIIHQFNFTAEFEYWRDHPDDKSFEFHGVEDQWYYKKMEKLPPKADGSPAAHLPSVDVAKTFVVEAYDYEKPLGYHQVERWQEKNLEKVDKWCPEWKLSKRDY